VIRLKIEFFLGVISGEFSNEVNFSKTITTIKVKVTRNKQLTFYKFLG